MKKYNTYIVINKYSGRSICGNIVLPVGTMVYAKDDYICCEKGPICAITSQIAYDHFAQNDDGNGLTRGQLIKDILHRLRRLKKYPDRSNLIWYLIYNDRTCLKYKHCCHNDYWLWNYDFYNAEIDDLKYIRSLIIKGKTISIPGG